MSPVRIVPWLAACALLCGGTPDAGTAPKPRKLADAFTIDGRSVSKEAFAAFEKTLTHREDRIMCAETTTGGFTSYEATAPDGARYSVKLESSNGATLDEATRLPR